MLIACLSAIGAAVFHLWSSDQRARLDAASARQFNSIARNAIAAAGELRAAQQAYIAVAQGEAFWFDRVAAIHGTLEQQVARLQPLAASAEARAALDTAASTLRDFAQMDQRARDYTRNGQLTAASHMIFADGIELTQRASEALAQAAVAEQVWQDAAAAQLQRTQIQALAGAAGVTVLGLALLAVAGRRGAAPAAAHAAQNRDTSHVDAVIPRRTQAPAPPTAQRTARAPSPQGPALGAPAAPEAPGAPAAQPVAAVAPSAAPRPAPPLASIATLCNDLAKLSDTRSLPALLERAGTVLDATGLIVWIADPDGRELAPILVHGYPPQLATRLGTIARDASNLTASAYRSGLLQTMRGDAISSGAMAVPLVAPGGCVGVMAAEVKNGGEQQEELLAAATIVAAQLATLVGPPSARARNEAAS